MAVLLESRAPSAERESRPATPDVDALHLDQAVMQPRVAEVRRRPVLSVRTARLAGLLMFGGLVVATAVEPVADGPRPVLPLWADGLSTVTLVLLLGCWAALAVGRRAGLWLGAAAGGGLVAMTVLCPAVDHHAIAGWWWAQLAVSAGIVALSAGLLAGTRPAGRSSPG